MRPSFIIAFILLIASFSTTAMLFRDGFPKSPSKGAASPSSVEIKWGEGSEAGVPANAIQK